MPKRGRKKHFSQKNKQKKAIATRLIEISLVMDDYVYKHKEITAREAEDYIEEILSYKNKCMNDLRSLQVIEKLTRCMKSIINTQKGNKNKCELFNTKETAYLNDTTSPKCSLADKDKEILTEINIGENNIDPMETDECIEIIDLCNEIEQIDQELNNETLNLNKNSIEERQTPTQNSGSLMAKQVTTKTTDLEITHFGATSPASNKSQSILSITETENHNLVCAKSKDMLISDGKISQVSYHKNNDSQLLVTTASYDILTEIDYSQSILSNSGNIKYDQSILQTQAGYIPNEINYSQDIESQSKDTENKTLLDNASEHLTLYPASKDINHKITERNDQEVTSMTNKISDLLDKNTSGYNMKPAANVNTNTETKTTKKRAPRKKKINDSQETDKPNVKRKPRKKKDKENINTDKDSKVACYKVITKESNENSIDFAWIENLNYVREISITESHTRSKDLSVNFWENYSLPNDWDDSEFMYEV